MEPPCWCETRFYQQREDFPATLLISERHFSVVRVEDQGGEWAKSSRGPRLMFSIKVEKFLYILRNSGFKQCFNQLNPKTVGHIDFWLGPDGRSANITELFMEGELKEDKAVVNFMGTASGTTPINTQTVANVPKFFDFQVKVQFKVQNLPEFFTRKRTDKSKERYQQWIDDV